MVSYTVNHVIQYELTLHKLDDPKMRKKYKFEMRKDIKSIYAMHTTILGGRLTKHINLPTTETKLHLEDAEMIEGNKIALEN